MRHYHPVAWLLCALAFAACPPPDKEQPGSDSLAQLAPDYAATAEVQLRATWSVYLAAHPDQLRTLLEEPPARGGWVKFYNRDYRGALEAFEGATTPGGRLGLARTHLALAELYLQVFERALEADRKYLDMWQENAGRVPRTPFFDFMAGENAFHRGDFDMAVPALERYRKAAGDGPMGAVAAVLEGAVLAHNGDVDGAVRMWADPGISRFPEAARLISGLALEAGGAKAWRQAKAAVARARILQALGRKTKAGGAAEGGESAYAQRNQAYAAALLGDVDQASSILARVDPKQADYEERVALAHGSVVRRYYDPLVLKTFATIHATRALEVLESVPNAGIYRMRAERVLGRPLSSGADLPSVVDSSTLPVFLFSQYPTPADLASYAAWLRGGEASGRGLLDTFAQTIEPAVAGHDEADRKETRLVVALAQRYVDIGRRLAGEVGGEGAETVLGLETIETDAARAMRLSAGRLMARGRLLDALYLLEHVVEKDRDGFTYRNEPGLFVDIARVYCALGRYREAMNYFYRLVERYPECWLVQETLGNLSVLGTVDQAGRTGQQD